MNFFAQGPFPVHSAHVGQICRVHYRWHAYFGSDVRVFRVYQSGNEQYAALERDPGVAVMAPAWVLNAAVCSTLSLGMPLVSIAALNDLHGVLVSLGFRRSCVDKESTQEAEDDPGTNTPSTIVAALSTPSDHANDTGGTGRCSKCTGATAAFRSGSENGGDER